MTLNYSKLNKRQDSILVIIDQKETISVSAIFLLLAKKNDRISKITTIRDLNKLLKYNLIQRVGKGRNVAYQLSEQYNFLKPINVNDYFKIETDQRLVKKNFNFDIINKLKNIFLTDEEIYLQEFSGQFKKNITKLPNANFKQEFERLVIELSWKSSVIEGNTYTLLETETLIREGKEAKGHKKEEAIMILNHKKAIDYIQKNISTFRKINISTLEDIHFLLTRNLGIARGLRKSPVGITGTKYRPINNVFQIKEALNKTCQRVNQERNVFAKAIILMIMIAYIQPFDDGNKRTGRLVANAILLAHDTCPLSYRSVSEQEYKKAVVLFYEQNNISYFKKLFIEQFVFAVKNYFLAS